MEEKKLTEKLILALAALTSWEEKAAGVSYRRAWRSYDFDALDALAEKGFVDFSYKAKSLHLTEEGYRAGIELAEAFAQICNEGNQEPCNEAQQVKKPAGNDFPTFAELENDLYAIYARTLAKYAMSSAPRGPIPPEERPQFIPVENRKLLDDRAFRIRIDLDLEGLHSCWREILVPAACTFLDLHIVIQRIFNWYDEHLFSFTTKSRGMKLYIDEDLFIDADADCYESEDVAIVEASTVRLGDVFGRTKTAKYSYDYGDGWEHKVKVVEIISASDTVVPQLLDGEGDAPPEDVGGPGGFEAFLKVMTDKADPEHEWMAEWAKDQMWEPFDLAEKQAELEDGFAEDRRLWLERIENGKAECL